MENERSAQQMEAPDIGRLLLRPDLPDFILEHLSGMWFLRVRTGPPPKTWQQSEEEVLTGADVRPVLAHIADALEKGSELTPRSPRAPDMEVGMVWHKEDNTFSVVRRMEDSGDIEILLHTDDRTAALQELNRHLPGA